MKIEIEVNSEEISRQIINPTSGEIVTLYITCFNIWGGLSVSTYRAGYGLTMKTGYLKAFPIYSTK